MPDHPVTITQSHEQAGGIELFLVDGCAVDYFFIRNGIVFKLTAQKDHPHGPETDKGSAAQGQVTGRFIGIITTLRNIGQVGGDTRIEETVDAVSHFRVQTDDKAVGKSKVDAGADKKMVGLPAAFFFFLVLGLKEGYGDHNQQ